MNSSIKKYPKVNKVSRTSSSLEKIPKIKLFKKAGTSTPKSESPNFESSVYWSINNNPTHKRICYRIIRLHFGLSNILPTFTIDNLE
jgi:hypothetical protein